MSGLTASQALHDRFDAIRRAELERLKKKLGGLTEADRQFVHQITTDVVVALTRGPVLALGGVLYTIPALALISILWPVFGLTSVTVTLALAVYALLVVLRNTLVGLEGVPDDVVDAARGMGYGRRRLLWRVELPLALPAIFAGVRLAVVSTVGLVTIGALVGHGGCRPRDRPQQQQRHHVPWSPTREPHHRPAFAACRISSASRP
jgi:hypothetical protein